MSSRPQTDYDDVCSGSCFSVENLPFYRWPSYSSIDDLLFSYKANPFKGLPGSSQSMWLLYYSKSPRYMEQVIMDSFPFLHLLPHFLFLFVIVANILTSADEHIRLPLKFLALVWKSIWSKGKEGWICLYSIFKIVNYESSHSEFFQISLQVWLAANQTKLDKRGGEAQGAGCFLKKLKSFPKIYGRVQVPHENADSHGISGLQNNDNG